jgi:hypothetical protein
MGLYKFNLLNSKITIVTFLLEMCGMDIFYHLAIISWQNSTMKNTTKSEN